jgi:hypothetical protein
MTEKKFDSYELGRRRGIIQFSSQMSIDINKRVTELVDAGMTVKAMEIIFGIKDNVLKRLMEAIE